MRKLVFLFSAILLALSFCPAGVSASGVASASPFMLIWADDFGDPTPDSRWTWIREDPALWSLTANPGHMQIQASGDLHQANNNQKNVLLTAAPEGDFRITTRTTVEPTANYHGASLYVYQDDDNYVEVSRLYADGQRVRLKAEIDGVTSGGYWDTSATTLYLRMVKEGNDYFGFFSVDGDTWTLITQANDLDLSNLQVGIGAHMGPEPTTVIANFDSFVLERMIYNAGWGAAFDSSVLDSRWTWIREDPALWSLTANPGHMRIVASGDLYQDYNNQENVLLTAAPVGDFRISTRITVTPTANYHGAGLLLYEDDDNYLLVTRCYRDGQTVRMRQEIDGVATTSEWDTTETTLYLRVVKEGNDYSGFASLDGDTWILIAQANDLDLNSLQVGIGAHMGPEPATVTADFDFFAIEYHRYFVFLPLVVR